MILGKRTFLKKTVNLLPSPQVPRGNYFFYFLIDYYVSYTLTN